MFGPHVGGQAPREEPTQHKFKVQMYDFACENLTTSDLKSEPYLKIDFDNFKIFKTVHEADSKNPEWGFKAGFQFVMHYLERLRDRKLRIHCINKVNGQPIGSASVDLQTIACGPAVYRLSLVDRRDNPCGVLKFVCVMKMQSEMSVILKDLGLTMQGCAAPARMRVYTTLETEKTEGCEELNLEHSIDGAWAGPYSLAFETTLADLLKAPDNETIQFVVIDEMGTVQGQAELAFRTHFTTKPDTVVNFKISVTYSTAADNDNERKMEPVGAVGSLEGNMMYQNLPAYAQMSGGCCVDGEVQGGHWLTEGLPYPQSMPQPPPLLREESHQGGLEAFNVDLQPDGDDEINLDDIDDQTIFDALDHIDLPPPWEKRKKIESDRTRVYFADPRSRRTTWKDPRFLPEHWDQRIDTQSGKVYWQYHKTRQHTHADPRGCPSGWDMRLSKAGDIYFAYLPAMRTTFVDPRGLPEGIEAALDDLGRMYFKNNHCCTTAWDDPREDQQEVTLTKWRQAQSSRWWKEQVWREIEEQQKQRYALDEEDEDASADGRHSSKNGGG